MATIALIVAVLALLIALAKGGNSAEVDELETRVEDLEGRLEDLESRRDLLEP